MGLLQFLHALYNDKAKQNKCFVSCNPTVRANNVPTVQNVINILKKI